MKSRRVRCHCTENADGAFQDQTCVAHFSTLAKSACVNLKPIRVLWQKYSYMYTADS